MDNIVEIDVSDVKSREELQELLYSALNLPEYYGHNWDAFDECIRDLDIDLPSLVRVRGMLDLSESLPKEAATFRECASDSEAVLSFEWVV
jgi:RNAse (barnase) inhibitor barstar